MYPLRWGFPLAIVVIAIGWVIAGHVERARAQDAASRFLAQLQQSQAAFRAAAGGFAATLDSLTTACAAGGPWLEAADLERLDRAGYVLRLRARTGAQTGPPDCHGRATVDDYHAAVQPASARTAPQRAFATTAAGRIFVFVDGIAPAEPDMARGGLATALEHMATFRIP